jgi:hypothetical protein
MLADGPTRGHVWFMPDSSSTGTECALRASGDDRFVVVTLPASWEAVDAGRGGHRVFATAGNN